MRTADEILEHVHRLYRKAKEFESDSIKAHDKMLERQWADRASAYLSLIGFINEE